jgi:hypothetical protein
MAAVLKPYPYCGSSKQAKHRQHDEDGDLFRVKKANQTRNKVDERGKKGHRPFSPTLGVVRGLRA